MGGEKVELVLKFIHTKKLLNSLKDLNDKSSNLLEKNVGEDLSNLGVGRNF